MFVGRNQEIKELKKLKEKTTSSLIVVHGRRRIGKSTLLSEFAKKHGGKFYEFQGIGPREGQGTRHQLENFCQQISDQFRVPKFSLKSWPELWSWLAKLTESDDCFILLDEISWMAQHDRDFAGQLKIAWDTKFSRNPKLILALCGSVSSWIEKNILHDTDFVGRVSWSTNLQPLPLRAAADFWQCKNVSVWEKLSFLSVSGCIPKYLEEMLPSESAEANIKRLCFKRTGYLYQDFKKIFFDIFNKRASFYQEIVSLLADRRLDVKSIAACLEKTQNGDITECLEDLCMAGFLKRDYTWNLDSKSQTDLTAKRSLFRIRDNYLRFYLKYVRPHSHQIENDIFHFTGFDNLTQWSSIRGLQFENLIHDNIVSIMDFAGIDRSDILQYGPFFQTKTQKRQGVQIDLLIHDRFNTLYLCEIKFRKKIGVEVIKEVQEKTSRLKSPKRFSVRPVLIFCGELSEDLIQANYFDKLIDMEEFFSAEEAR